MIPVAVHVGEFYVKTRLWGDLFLLQGGFDVFGQLPTSVLRHFVFVKLLEERFK